MTLQASDWRTPRTLVVGLGAQGRAVVEAAARRWAGRGGWPATVAFLAIVDRTGAPPEPCGDVSAAPEPADAGAAPLAGGRLPPQRETVRTLVVSHDAGQLLTRRLARQATLAAGDAIVRGLADALGEISRIQPMHSGAPPLRGSGQGAELAVAVVAALDDPFAGAVAIDLAYLCRHLARQRLNSSAGVTGLLLLPDPLHADDPRPALARTYAALCEIEATMQPGDGWPAAWGDALPVDGWGPAFDRGFLMGALNSQGLGLPQAEERIEMAAEALVQAALTPLGARCDPPLPPAWHSGQRSQAYGSLGVAAWVYPAAALVETCAHRLAGDMLASWTEAPAPAAAAWAAAAGSAFVEARHLTPADLGDALPPAHLANQDALMRPLAVPQSPAGARTMRAAMDAEMARRVEPLAAARPDLDRLAAALAETLEARLAEDVAVRLDGGAGSLGEAAVFLDAVDQRLGELVAGFQQAGQARWGEMERVDAEITRLGAHLDALGQHIPGPAGREVLAAVMRPRRLWAIVHALRELARLGPGYAALLLRQTALAMDVLRHDLAMQVYDGVRAGVERQRQRIASLHTAARAAQRLVATPLPSPCGALGFSLEQSALTPESIEDLYRSAAGAPADTLAGFAQTPDRLSAWPAAGADGEDLAGVCLDYARRRCRRLEQVTLESLLVHRLGQTPRARGEALQALAAAATPFLGWDEARLRADEHHVLHECVVLGLPDGVSTSAGSGQASPLLEGLGEILWAQVVAGGDPRRLTMLSAVQGLPLAALAGLEDYASAYRAEDPASWHVFEDWTPAGEPLESLPETEPLETAVGAEEAMA